MGWTCCGLQQSLSCPTQTQAVTCLLAHSLKVPWFLEQMTLFRRNHDENKTGGGCVRERARVGATPGKDWKQHPSLQRPLAFLLHFEWASSIKSRITLAGFQHLPYSTPPHPPKSMSGRMLLLGERNSGHRLTHIPQGSLSSHGWKTNPRKTTPALSMCGPFSLSLSTQCSGTAI